MSSAGLAGITTTLPRSLKQEPRVTQIVKLVTGYQEKCKEISTKQKGPQNSFQRLNKKGIFRALDLWKSIL